MRKIYLWAFAIAGLCGAHAEAGVLDCKGEPINGSVFVYELKSQGEGNALKSNEISVHSVQLCKIGEKIELYNKTPITSGQLGFFCDSEKAGNDDLWIVDLQKEKTLPPAFLGFALKRCLKGSEGKLQASWVSHAGAAPHPAHEISYETDGDLNESFITQQSTFLVAKPAEEKTKRYIAAYEQRLKQKDSAGNGWIAGFWNACFQEQIAAVQEGRKIGQAWLPNKGATFSADDGLFTVANVISESPVRLLIEGPAQADSTIANRCYAVLTLKDKSQLQVTQTPTPGYMIKIGDQIHGFSVKMLGTATVKIKTARAISAEEKVLPEFQLVGKIPMASRP